MTPCHVLIMTLETRLLVLDSCQRRYTHNVARVTSQESEVSRSHERMGGGPPAVSVSCESDMTEVGHGGLAVGFKGLPLHKIYKGPPARNPGLTSKPPLGGKEGSTLG